jgi:hypothetical protein
VLGDGIDRVQQHHPYGGERLGLDPALDKIGNG